MPFSTARDFVWRVLTGFFRSHRSSCRYQSHFSSKVFETPSLERLLTRMSKAKKFPRNNIYTKVLALPFVYLFMRKTCRRVSISLFFRLRGVYKFTNLLHHYALLRTKNAIFLFFLFLCVTRKRRLRHVYTFRLENR